jgi:hypothetical protein
MGSTPFRLVTLALGLSILPSGCASIISGRHADVAISSYPSDAHVVIHDKFGRQVASLQTPGVVALKRRTRYFLPARYSATIEAPGYQMAHVAIGSTINPWVAGNILIGGIPGLIVDNATGAAWKPKHEEIHQELTPLVDTKFQGSISSDTPPAAETVPHFADRSARKSR